MLRAAGSCVLGMSDLAQHPEHGDGKCRRGARPEQAERGPTGPADEHRLPQGLERRRAELLGELAYRLLELPAVGAAAEMRHEHPLLELGELVVEPQRDLPADALTHQRRPNRVHVRLDEVNANELGGGRSKIRTSGLAILRSTDLGLFRVRLGCLLAWLGQRGFLRGRLLFRDPGSLTRRVLNSRLLGDVERIDDLREVAGDRLLLRACGTSGGSSSAQISCAFQQRVRNRHPEGGLAGLGTSPSSTIRARFPRRSGTRSAPPRGAPACRGASAPRRSACGSRARRSSPGT